MTTDTAVRTTRYVVQDKGKTNRTADIGGEADSCKVPLEKIQYVDHPEIRTNEHESTEMPFRYIKDSKGVPIMPEVCIT